MRGLCNLIEALCPGKAEDDQRKDKEDKSIAEPDESMDNRALDEGHHHSKGKETNNSHEYPYKKRETHVI